MLDAGSPLPLYHQVSRALRESILAGSWAPNEAIPPERELIERFGVSRITVRQALTDLVAEGLLYRQHGRGTFVASRSSAPIAETLSELTGHLEELQLRGLEPEVEVLSLALLPMPAEIAQALERPVGAEGWFLRRLVRVEGEPLMLSEIYLPSDLGILLRDDEVRSSGMARLLEEAGFRPTRGAQRIAARAVTAEQARLLAIREGEPALRVIRVIAGRDGQPLVWFRTLYRADRYEYEVELKRRG